MIAGGWYAPRPHQWPQPLDADADIGPRGVWTEPARLRYHVRCAPPSAPSRRACDCPSRSSCARTVGEGLRISPSSLSAQRFVSMAELSVLLRINSRASRANTSHRVLWCCFIGHLCQNKSHHDAQHSYFVHATDARQKPQNSHSYRLVTHWPPLQTDGQTPHIPSH